MLVENRQFEPTLLLFGAPVLGDTTGILPRFLASENYSPWRCLHDLTFSHFGTIPVCDRRMDGQMIR